MSGAWFVNGYRVKVSPWITAGEAMLGLGGYHFRHMSEFFLYASGAVWHVNGSACPTATNPDDCRCMLGDEA